MNFNEIKYVQLNESQKKKAIEVLCGGVTLLKKWAVFYPTKKFRKFRNDVMNGDKNPQNQVECTACFGKHAIHKEQKCSVCKGIGTISTNGIPSDRMKEFHADLPKILMIRTPDAELDNRSVEQAVLESLSALAKNHVNQWSYENSPNGITRHDYTQEAYMAIIEAMYHYDNTKSDLTTFVWWSLRHKMMNVTNQGNLFCPMTNPDLELVIRYEKAKQNGGTFDEIVDSLGLTTDQGKYLGSILNKVFSESQFGGDDVGENQANNDYTGYRTGSDRKTVATDVVGEEEFVNVTLDRANLTLLERKVILAAMEPYNGWQSDFAKTHINPTNGKHYSRMWITLVLAKAREKVAKVLEREAA